MSEKIDQLNPSIENTPENVGVMEALTSQEFKDHRALWLSEQLDPANDGPLGHVSRLLMQSERNQNAGMDAFLEKGDYDTDRRLSNKAGELINMAYRIFGQPVVEQYRRSKNALEALQKDDVQFWGSEGREVFDRLVADAPAIEDGIDRQHTVPPALDPGASREDYINYLSRKNFIPSARLNYAVKEGSPNIIIKIGQDELYQVPTSNVVSASSFDSWVGRGQKGDGDKAYVKSDNTSVTGRSIDAIIDYSERDTPLPPVDNMIGYVQPDGKVIFSAVNDNHRTAAAIARGYESINVAGTVTFRMLTKNLV